MPCLIVWHLLPLQWLLGKWQPASARPVCPLLTSPACCPAAALQVDQHPGEAPVRPWPQGLPQLLCW